jgi:four helix bundle protein
MIERPHERLIVWKKSIELFKAIYTETSPFPREELYSLTNQIRRAAISIPSNIAEGAARWSNSEKLHFFRIARASLSELETQIEISNVLGYMSQNKKETLYILTNAVGRLLSGLVSSRERQS